MDTRSLSTPTKKKGLFERLLYKIYRIMHPEAPWLTSGAIKYCEDYLTKDMKALEWGSGGSTTWFGARVGHLISVEHNPEWYQKVSADIKAQGATNIDYRHVPLDHDEKEPCKPVYEKTPAYVAVADELEPDSLDFAVVDGHYRHACILAVMDKIKPGGILLIDNTDWLPLADWGVRPDWHVVHRTANVITETTLWQKPGGTAS